MNNSSEDTFLCPSWFATNPWWVYIAVEATLYLLGLGAAALLYAVQRWRSIPSPSATQGWVQSLRKYAGPKSRFAIAVEIYAASLNTVYVCLYVARSYFGVSRHLDLLLTIYLAIEVCLSALLVIPLLLRMLHAQSPLKALLSLYTVVDLLTLPHPIISLATGCDWLGLRSLRFISLNSINSVLVQLRIVHSSVAADLVQLLIAFVTIWLAAAGLIHLFEASGDPWHSFSNAQEGSYLEYVYFAMTTMTTVGYGDITPDTAIGRLFVTFFMVGGIAIFALAIGPLTDLLAADWKYYTWYSPNPCQKHIVVCGSLSGRRMARLLQDLFHSDKVPLLDRPDVVFLSEQYPTADMKRAVQSYFPHARLLVGTLLKRKDLQRVQLREAGACIILADMTTTEEESADGSAVMRYIAVKNFTKQVRIIMQVLKSETSAQLHALPCWNRAQDSVVCISEWRLGWLASACYCPGLSTILGNLLYPTSHSGKKHSSEDMVLYSEGASHEIYSVRFPQPLTGRTPKEVVYVCNQLNLLMIAVQFRNTTLHFNPSSLALQSLSEATTAYILAGSRTDLKPLLRLTEERVQSLLLQAATSFSTSTWLNSSAVEPKHVTEEDELTLLACANFSIPSKLAPIQRDMENHFVLCLLTNERSPAVDLRTFASLLLQKDPGSHLVVVAKDTYIQKLMDAGHTVNHHNSAVHFVIGSSLDVATLQQARVAQCKSCAIFTVNPNPDIEEPALWDKDAILCLRVLEGISHDNGSPIPVVVELLEESNVQFVSLEDEEEEEEELHLSWPYALGQVTTMGMLDVLLSASYFDTAGTTIAESILKSVCITVEPVSALPHHMTTFGDAFSYYLTKGRLCMAVKRLQAGGSDDDIATAVRYFPITAPRQEMALRRATDLLVVVT